MSDTPSTRPGNTFTSSTHPDAVRRLLALPAEQRPDWLNQFLGDMTIPPIPEDSPHPLNDVVMANTAQGEKNATLAFPLAAAEHAAATEHKLGYGETEAAPRLRWVKDHGTPSTNGSSSPTKPPSPSTSRTSTPTAPPATSRPTPPPPSSPPPGSPNPQPATPQRRAPGSRARMDRRGCRLDLPHARPHRLPATLRTRSKP
ncbi:hypothetical protein ACIHEJ_38975 [Streptomyces sp. NPDC052301]|uniref:hypothetical protein n=1 Tax=Streptomyces sp. NPDC052301 TaxID=3365687 RepID=UPI0037D4C998